MDERYIRMDLRVNNHPGVMSHVCGLFVRRNCNVEGILCAPVNDTESVIRLLVRDNGRMEQIARHAGQLEDVHQVDMADGGREELERMARELAVASG